MNITPTNIRQALKSRGIEVAGSVANPKGYEIVLAVDGEITKGLIVQHGGLRPYTIDDGGFWQPYPFTRDLDEALASLGIEVGK